jgi:hypothetical protein
MRLARTVKQKPPVGKPRTLSAAARLPKAAIAVASRAKERARGQAEPAQGAAETYAVDRASEIAADAARIAGDTVKEALRPNGSRLQDAKERFARKEIEKTRSPGDRRQGAGRRIYSLQQAARQSAAKQAGQSARARHAAIKTADRAVKPPKQTIKASAKAAKKTAKAIKTAEKASVKTAQGAVAVRAAAKFAVTIAKALARAATAMAKAIAAAAKALIAWIAAGSWVIVLIIIAVGAIAAILCSAFGVFFLDAADPGKLKAAIVEINTNFTDGLQAEIDRRSAGPYDAVLFSCFVCNAFVMAFNVPIFVGVAICVYSAACECFACRMMA